ncbi:MAG: hypothetical protein ABI456_16460 [Ktedonobacteraceae bacterium]
MAIMSMRTIVRAHLARERIDVLLSVLAPLVIMLESGYANAWVFAGGRLGLDVNSVMAIGRGIFLEALIYVCFKLIRMFTEQRRWLVLPLPFLVGVVGMIVSAGCNLGWLAHSPEMLQAIGLVSQFLPGVLVDVFRVGLGLLFPVAVGLFALFDVRHLIEQALMSAHLDNQAVHVHRSELHRTAYLKSLKRASKTVTKEYDTIAGTDAQSMVAKVKNGDLSFGADDVVRVARQSSVTRISALPSASPQRPAIAPAAPQRPPQPPVSPQQPPMPPNGRPLPPMPPFPSRPR